MSEPLETDTIIFGEEVNRELTTVEEKGNEESPVAFKIIRKTSKPCTEGTMMKKAAKLDKPRVIEIDKKGLPPLQVQ